MRVSKIITITRLPNTIGKLHDRVGAGGEAGCPRVTEISPLGRVRVQQYPNQVEGDEQVWRCVWRTVLCSAARMKKDNWRGYCHLQFAE